MQSMVYLKDVVTLAHKPEMCNGCGICLSVCPRRVLQRSNGKVEITQRDACIECGACQRNCPQGAVTVRAGRRLCVGAYQPNARQKEGLLCCRQWTWENYRIKHGTVCG